MTEESTKLREDQARREARRRGLTLRKSRTRNTADPGYGRFWLHNDRNEDILGSTHGATLEIVERYLGLA